MKSNPLPESHLKAWQALLKTQAGLLRSIGVALRDQGGLPLESYDVLLNLFYSPEKQERLRDLQKRVVLTRSGISRLITRLEREGLVTRECVEGDKRGVYARLTPEGEAAFRRTWPIYKQAIGQSFAQHLTQAQAQQLTSILNGVRSALEGS